MTARQGIDWAAPLVDDRPPKPPAPPAPDHERLGYWYGDPALVFGAPRIEFQARERVTRRGGYLAAPHDWTDEEAACSAARVDVPDWDDINARLGLDAGDIGSHVPSASDPLRPWQGAWCGTEGARWYAGETDHRGRTLVDNDGAPTFTGPGRVWAQFYGPKAHQIGHHPTADHKVLVLRLAPAELRDWQAFGWVRSTDTGQILRRDYRAAVRSLVPGADRLPFVVLAADRLQDVGASVVAFDSLPVGFLPRAGSVVRVHALGAWSGNLSGSRSSSVKVTAADGTVTYRSATDGTTPVLSPRRLSAAKSAGARKAAAARKERLALQAERDLAAVLGSAPLA